MKPGGSSRLARVDRNHENHTFRRVASSVARCSRSPRHPEGPLCSDRCAGGISSWGRPSQPGCRSASIRRYAEAQNLERDFQAAGFPTQLTLGDLQDPIPGLLKLGDAYGNRVDLLLGLRGLEPQAFSRTAEVPFQGRTVRFIGREDFIAMKAFAGVPPGLVDADRTILRPVRRSTLGLCADSPSNTAGKRRRHSIVCWRAGGRSDAYRT